MADGGFDIGSLIGQIGQIGGGGSGGGGGGGTGFTSVGGYGGADWGYIVKQIIGHLAAAGAAYADYRAADIAEDTAGEQQRTNALLTTIDMILHGNRQQAYQQAVASTLDEIEQAYRSPEAKRAIEQLKEQFGVAAAGEAAAQAVAERGEMATVRRQQATRRGMRGGSVAEAGDTREAVLEAGRQGEVEAKRKGTERGVQRGMEAKRVEARTQARSQQGPRTGSLMPYQAVLDAQGQLGAAKTEGIQGLKPIIRGVSDAVASVLSFGEQMQMDADAASEAEAEGRPYRGRAFYAEPDRQTRKSPDDDEFSPYSVHDWLGAAGLQ
jgi:hypothetical protein